MNEGDKAGIEPDERLKQADLIIVGLVRSAKIIVFDLRQGTSGDSQIGILTLSDSFFQEEVDKMDFELINFGQLSDDSSEKFKDATALHLAVTKSELRDFETSLFVTNVRFRSIATSVFWWQIERAFQLKGGDSKEFEQITGQLLGEDILGSMA